MALFGLFGDDDAEPNVVLVRNPNNNEYSEDYNDDRAYIKVTLDSEGNISARDYTDSFSGSRMLNEGEAIEASSRDLEKLRAGKVKLKDIENMHKKAPEEVMKEEANDEESLIEGMRKNSKIGGDRRRNRIDRAVEEATEGPENY